MDVITFISRQFWISREMNKWGVQRLFDATQMVPSTRTTLQVTSTLLGMFWEKIWLGQEISKNVAKTAKLKVILHAFSFFRGPSYKHHGMPLMDTGGHGKEVMWLGTNIWMSLRSLRGNLGFLDKWTDGVFTGFSRQHKWYQPPTQCHRSRRLSYGCFGRKYDQAGRSQKLIVPKAANTLSGFPGSRASNTTGRLLWPWGGHWKGVMWLGTNMWMPLLSFRDSFRFHEKWTNGVFRGFSRQHKWF